MSIYEALNQVSNWKRKEYFLWKFDLNMFATDKTEEILKKLQLQSLASMHRWEKSPEYNYLVNVLIESRSAKDLEDIYAVVRTKALDGDEKNIKLLMDIQKQVREFNKETKKFFASATKEENVHNPVDDLEL